jgi:hypothetical protein
MKTWMPDTGPGMTCEGYVRRLRAKATCEGDLPDAPHIAFTISRSLNFCSLPVEVFGISANKI